MLDKGFSASFQVQGIAELLSLCEMACVSIVLFFPCCQIKSVSVHCHESNFLFRLSVLNKYFNFLHSSQKQIDFFFLLSFLNVAVKHHIAKNRS